VAQVNGYLRRDRCPICDAPAAAATGVWRSQPPAESLPLDALGKFYSGYDSRRVFFSYARCTTCAGLYCPTFFTPAQLDALYSRQPENMEDVPLAAREATSRGYVELLCRHAPLAGEYLELGPDIGLFAGPCAERGRLERLHLFEPNQAVHAALAARLAGHQVRISSARYDADSLPSGSLSTAVLIHVLDHLLDPAAVLANVRDDLAPGGTVFIATHDERSLLARALGRRWPPYTLQHPQLFNPQSIARLLERCGFTVLATQRTANHFPVTHLARSVFSVLGLEHLAPRYTHPLMVRVRLGNFVTIARKQD
jgi:SAM-dependent methyltransferase